jgi:hypothetical protein
MPERPGSHCSKSGRRLERGPHGQREALGEKLFDRVYNYLRDCDSWQKIGDDDFWDFKLHGFI